MIGPLSRCAMRWYAPVVALLLCAAGAGCGASQSASFAPQASKGYAREFDDGERAAPMKAGRAVTASRGPSSGDDASSADRPAADRIMVYTADMTVVVGDTDAARKSAEKLATDLGGYLQQINGDVVTIRVPAARFDEAMVRVESFGKVARRDVQASDVTEQYTDLEARLRNAQNVRERLTALLAKAEDVEAAVVVERELGRVTEEIERLTGQLNLLKSRVAFSTISILLERVASPVGGPQFSGRLPFAWLRELGPSRLLR